MDQIINRVALSPLITLDLKDFQAKGDRVFIDLNDILFQGLILREADLRQFVKDTDWSLYQHKHVAIGCTAEAIIPSWAYMIIVSQLFPYATTIVQGTIEDLEKKLYWEVFSKVDFSSFEGKKVVIKGCSDIPLPQFAFVEITKSLMPYCASIMYGEPCSTVPIFKRRVLN